MYQIAIINRDEFLGWLGGNFTPRTTEAKSVKCIKDDQIYLLWFNSSATKSDKSDPLIIVSPNSLEDFFAFTSTYVSTYRPFSAFFEVLTTDSFETIVNSAAFSDTNIATERLIGVAIAEALLQASDETKVDNISVQAVLATLSSSIISALVNNYPSYEIDNLIERWSRCRKFFRLDPLKLEAENLRDFWRLIISAFSRTSLLESDNPEEQFIRDVLNQADVRFSWQRLVSDIPQLHEVLDLEGVSREDQVRMLDITYSILSRAENVSLQRKEIIAAYLVARLSNGDFEYISFCKSLMPRLPRTSLWFGFFSGCLEDSNILFYSDCLGRRVSRELLKKFSFSSPKLADISFTELEIQHRGSAEPRYFRTDQQAFIIVELLPGVTARYRLARDKTSTTANRPNANYRVAEARAAVAHAYEVLSSIESANSTAAPLLVGEEHLRKNKKSKLRQW